MLNGCFWVCNYIWLKIAVEIDCYKNYFLNRTGLFGNACPNVNLHFQITVFSPAFDLNVNCSEVIFLYFTKSNKYPKRLFSRLKWQALSKIWSGLYLNPELLSNICVMCHMRVLTEFSLWNFLNVKKFVAQNKFYIINLEDHSGIRTNNQQQSFA